MKTILVDDRAAHFSGVGRYISELLNFGDKSYFKILRLSEYDNSPPYSLAEQTKLGRVIAKIRPDLMHFTHIARPWSNMPVPTITTVHDLTLLDFDAKPNSDFKSQAKRKALGIGVKKIIHNSSELIVLNNFTKKQLVSFGANPEKINTIYQGCSVINNTPQPIKNTPSRFFLYVGNAYPHKNLALLVAALEEDPELKIVAAGNPESGYKYFSHPQFIKLGRVSDGQLAWLYQAASALLQPSKSEGFGLTGLEAMANGCPVLSSNATCLPEIYGSAALYFGPNSVEELLSVIKNLEIKKDSLVSLGKLRVKDFSWQKTTAETFAVYQKLLAQD